MAIDTSAQKGLPLTLGPLTITASMTGKSIGPDEVNGGSGWKLIQLHKGEVFEAFGDSDKTAFKWVARVPKENWDWA